MRELSYQAPVIPTKMWSNRGACGAAVAVICNWTADKRWCTQIFIHEGHEGTLRRAKGKEWLEAGSVAVLQSCLFGESILWLFETVNNKSCLYEMQKPLQVRAGKNLTINHPGFFEKLKWQIECKGILYHVRWQAYLCFLMKEPVGDRIISDMSYGNSRSG